MSSLSAIVRRPRRARSGPPPSRPPSAAPFPARRAALRTALRAALSATALASGCALPPGGIRGLDDPAAVAVIGVSRRENVGEGFNPFVAARDLVERLADGGRRRVLPPERVRAALGDAAWTAVMRRDARGGTLDERDVRLLSDVGLGTRLALIVRLERDRVVELGPRVDAVRDAAGRVWSDRLRVSRTTLRESEISAELIDLAAARSLWRRSFAAEPRTHTETVRYRGSSFSGSVAARLANSVLNGPDSEDAPAPASLRDTLESLFDELARALPSR